MPGASGDFYILCSIFVDFTFESVASIIIRRWTLALALRKGEEGEV